MESWKSHSFAKLANRCPEFKRNKPDLFSIYGFLDCYPAGNLFYLRGEPGLALASLLLLISLLEGHWEFLELLFIDMTNQKCENKERWVTSRLWGPRRASWKQD
ncbi:unnamed protein product [Cuscuta europaea]|uniref:Uncharacterized protein n=1 Tax=Cuscuta europaea TaxID=41803 RepID=A0A9P0YQJ6_CUSEU|nr:unnamed protein product [Cuscuta europaea]